ncbi:MAG TPA: MFS transporter [Thermoplasmata archaeon]|jgi:CP family cyanate transporter-like MFS transporter|nr:MFS transporter [Thermoplasmata archaeon]
MASIRRSSARPNVRGKLALAWAVGFAMWGLLLAVNALLPTIQAELGLSYTVRSLVLALPFLSMAASAIPGGYLADRLGIHGTVSLGGAVACFGAGLRAVPGPPALLLVAASIFGAGLGIVIPNLPKLVGMQYGKNRGLATGVYSTGLISGSVTGVYATGPIASVIGGWRAALLAWAFLGIVVVAAWGLLLRREPVPAQGPQLGYGPLLRRRELWILAFLFASGNASYFFLVGAYPQILTVRGLPPDASTAQLALLIAVGVPAIFLAPILSDRARVRRPFVWGPHALIAALLLLLPTVPLAAVPLVSVGLGFSEMAIFALALLLPVDVFPREDVGRAGGVVVSIAYVGALLGPLGSGLAVDLLGTLDAAVIAFASLSLVTTLVVFLLPETGRRERRA